MDSTCANGLTTPNQLEAKVNRAMMKRGQASGGSVRLK